MIPPPPPPPPATLEAPPLMAPPAEADTKAPQALPKVEILPQAKALFGTPPAQTGTDFLPAEALERAKKGSFLEKVKRP